MKRKIIKINESLCDGCGDCVVSCSEGAIKIVNGKAKLIRDDFCDGFGDCVGSCHANAITIEERETLAFDIIAVKENLMKTKGKEAVWHMEDNQVRRKQGSGCPGMTMQSSLAQWPVQLHLIDPSAPFLKGRDLVLLSTCSPVASSEVHRRYIKNRSVVLACPKLDRTEPYQEKLAAIFKEAQIAKIIILRMEVPCCAGLTALVLEAAKMFDLMVEEHIVSIEGQFKGQRTV